jgi:hypothetical protein
MDQMQNREAPPPLADNARTACQPGTCALCGHPIWARDRIATLACGGDAHIGCCALLDAEARRQRAVRGIG